MAKNYMQDVAQIAGCGLLNVIMNRRIVNTAVKN